MKLARLITFSFLAFLAFSSAAIDVDVDVDESFYKGVKANDKKDYIEAAYWYKKAAKQGLASAQYNLAVMHYSGTGITKDYKQAVFWYKKSAIQDYRLAQYNLALMYYEGKGVPHSIEASYIWNTLAAENGYDEAKKSKALDAKELSPLQLEKAQEKARQVRTKINALKETSVSK